MGAEDWGGVVSGLGERPMLFAGTLLFLLGLLTGLAIPALRNKRMGCRRIWSACSTASCCGRWGSSRRD